MSCQRDLFNQVLLIPQGKKSGHVQFHLKKLFTYDVNPHINKSK